MSTSSLTIVEARDIGGGPRPGSRSEAPLAQEASVVRTHLLSVLVWVILVGRSPPPAIIHYE